MDSPKLHAVIDQIILYMEREGVFLNLVKLQRILYIANAWFMAFHNGRRLFNETFEAWKYGPVCRRAATRFSGFSSFYTPITVHDRWFDNPSEGMAQLAPDELEHLTLVLTTYGHLSAFEMEEMLRHEMPWQATRAGLNDDEPSNRRIADEAIIEYYGRSC